MSPPARPSRPARTGQPPLDKFSVAPAFLATSQPVADLKLCAARLQNDARWPWIVLIPHAPLLAMTLTVNVIATLLMAPALLFLLLLVNDREIMRGLENRWRENLAGGTVVIAISCIGAFYGVMTVFPHLFGK